MDANNHILQQLFGYDQQLQAPLFQRPYVWGKKKQWEPLWEDIRGIADDLYQQRDGVKPHFLGAVVLDQVEVPTGELAKRYIIDGQQRLATLQVAFAAFRDVCNEVVGGGKIARFGQSRPSLLGVIGLRSSIGGR